MGFHHVCRIMDPNMGRSPSSATQRNKTWQDEFDQVGLQFDLADDGEVGRHTINEYLKPDGMTDAPASMLTPVARP